LESQAFRKLLVEELDAVYRLAWHLARNPDEAAELAQETYLKALGAEDRFELRSFGIRPWLFRILHNCFYTRIGKRQREPTLAEDLSHESVPSELDHPPPAWDLASLDWEQVDERLKAAIEDLGVPYREVLLLWAVEGLKYKEIAEALDIPLGTVMSRLYRARQTLSRQLGEYAAEQGIAVPETS